MKVVSDPRRTLKDHFGYDTFRDRQEEIVQAVLDGQDVAAFMRTGGGKSICYQVPALSVRGTAIVVSPLISLMKDQVDGLQRRGIPAACLHSGQTTEQSADVIQALQSGRLKLLYVSPERAVKKSFHALASAVDLSFVAVDEAHCVSMWGHDFRIAYSGLRAAFDAIGSMRGTRLPRLALTATATPQVRADISAQLLDAPVEFTSSIDRPNIRFVILAPASKDEALGELLATCEGQPTVVYTATVKAAEEIYSKLTARGLAPALYHGRLDSGPKNDAQDRFLRDEAPLLIATTAFGMGIDKPNIRNVIHYQMPGTIEAYYQEAGRAGRDGHAAASYVLYSERDRRVHEYFIANSYPSPEVIEAVFQAVVAIAPDLPVTVDYQDLANLCPTSARAPQVESALKILASQGAVNLIDTRADGEAMVEVSDPFCKLDLDYLDTRQRIAHDNLGSMSRLCRARACRREYLQTYFGEKGAPCGNCDYCLAHRLGPAGTASASVDPAALQALELLATAPPKLTTRRAVEVLAGVRSARVRRLGLTDHGCFARLSRYTIDDVVALIRSIVRDGSARVDAETDHIAITDAGARLLQGTPAQAALPIGISPRAPGDTTRAGDEQGGDALRQALLALRKKVALQAQKAENTVLRPAVIDAIVERRPGSRDQLISLGLSRERCDTFGNELLATVAAHEPSKPANPEGP